MGCDNLLGSSSGCISIEEEVAGWLSVGGLLLKRVVLYQRGHQSIVTHLRETSWNLSLVRSIHTVEGGWEVLEVLSLKKSPVVVQVG